MKRATPAAVTLTVIPCLLAGSGLGGAADWRPTSGPTGVRAAALVEAASGDTLVGTSKGVFRLTGPGGEWQPSGLQDDYITALLTAPTGAVYAGTWNDGVSLSLDDGRTWSPVRDGLDEPPLTVHDLIETPWGSVIAATDGGATWATLPPEWPGGTVVEPAAGVICGMKPYGVSCCRDGGLTWTLAHHPTGFGSLTMLVHPSGNLVASVEAW